MAGYERGRGSLDIRGGGFVAPIFLPLNFEPSQKAVFEHVLLRFSLADRKYLFTSCNTAVVCEFRFVVVAGIDMRVA